MNPDAFDFEVQDKHLAPLRLFLMGDSDGLDPFEKEPENPSVKAERWLFAMAAAAAVKRRFSDSFTRQQIIRFVADMRISMGKYANDVNPRVAEELIRMALNDVRPGEVDLKNRDPEADLMTCIAILDQLRHEIINEVDMDEFLQQTKQYAQQVLESQQALIAKNAHPLFTP